MHTKNKTVHKGWISNGTQQKKKKEISIMIGSLTNVQEKLSGTFTSIHWNKN